MLKCVICAAETGSGSFCPRCSAALTELGAAAHDTVAWRCPVCGRVNGKPCCPDCGFDRTTHCEALPTLAPVGNVMSIAGLRRAFRAASAAAAGDAKWQYANTLFFRALQAERPEDKHRLFLNAALMGYRPAQTQAGICCLYGYGVKADAAEAKEWFRKAAEQGDPEAACYLGRICGEGLTGPADYRAAARWFRFAAEAGYRDAELALAEYLEHGLGLRASMEQALKWYEKACEHGSGRAAVRLGDHALESGNADRLERAERYYTLAAENGDTSGLPCLGIRLKSGMGVDRDFEKAGAILRLAAHYGDREARRQLDRPWS